MTSALSRRHRPIPSRPVLDMTPAGIPEASPGAIAKAVQSHCPGWMVFWSPWRRTFTAIACFTRDPVLIDTPRLNELLDSMREVESAAESRHAAPTWATTGSYAQAPTRAELTPRMATTSNRRQ